MAESLFAVDTILGVAAIVGIAGCIYGLYGASLLILSGRDASILLGAAVGVAYMAIRYVV